jgi:hypothetical protein
LKYAPLSTMHEVPVPVVPFTASTCGE